MTSSNVIEYRIEKNGEQIGQHRENLLCKSHFEKLLQYEPLKDHIITSYGYDEEEEYWEGPSENLEIFLKKMIPVNQNIREYFSKIK